MKIIVSQPSMKVLTTPFLSYCEERLTEEIGASDAKKAIQYAYHYQNRMDEGDVGSADNVAPEERSDEQSYVYGVEHFLHPVLGIMEGMIKLGYSEEFSLEILKEIWNEAPENVKR